MLSRRHSKVEPSSLEAEVNVGVRVVVFEPSAGPSVIVVSGAVASTVNERSAGVESVSAPFFARTLNV